MATNTQDEILHAYTETDVGTSIRLRGYETSDGWMEAVEVVDGNYDDDAADVTTLYERRGLAATGVYNQTIQPFLGDEEGGRPMGDFDFARGDRVQVLPRGEHAFGHRRADAGTLHGTVTVLRVDNNVPQYLVDVDEGGKQWFDAVAVEEEA